MRHTMSPAAAVACFAGFASAQPTAILNVTVIDAERGVATPGRAILVEGDRIAAVADAAAIRLAADARTIDGSGLYAFPGLIDSHVHLIDPETHGPLLIAHGVTMVRDMGGPTQSILATRRRLNDGEITGPRMIASGNIVDGVPPVWPFSEGCETPEQGRAAVRKLHGAGADFIKVYSKLKPDVYRAVLDEAAKVGLRAVGHAPQAITLADAASAGQHTNEHLMRAESIIEALLPAPADPPRGGLFASFSHWLRYPELDRDTLGAALKDLAATGMVQCPTLVVQVGIASIADGSGPKDPRMQYVSAATKGFWQGEQYKSYAEFVGRALPHMRAMLAEMHKAGVPLIAGTDLANPHVYAGSSLHDELAIFVDAGMTPAQALRSATALPATVLGLDDQGVIAEGKLASMVLTDANPLEDIRHASRIRHVFLAGEHFDRAELDALLARAKAAAEGARAGAPATNPEADDLSVPGELVAKGTYTLKFGQFDAGTETFAIGKTAEGFHIVSVQRPKGGMQPATRNTVTLGPDYAFRSATWTTLTRAPVAATYTLEGGVLKARAKNADADEKPQDMPIAPDLIIAPPIYASEFITANARPMAVGEVFSGSSVSWGMNGWQMLAAPLTMQRKPDETIRRGDADVPVRRYSSVLTTDMGKFESESWVDARGIMLMTTLKMPFGQLTMQLAE